MGGMSEEKGNRPVTYTGAPLQPVDASADAEAIPEAGIDQDTQTRDAQEPQDITTAANATTTSVNAPPISADQLSAMVSCQPGVNGNTIIPGHNGLTAAQCEREMADAMAELTAGLEALDQADEEFLEILQKLKSLLLDQGSFHDLCQKGYEQQGNALKTAADLKKALDVISADIGLEPVTMDEADELFLENLDAFEYYTLAKKFFESVSRTLDEDNENLLC
ncbi:unnamed protein product [Amoebophrya sp. A120]|nr:unnamed protein product [Amoebophrya sp. A120]|eukprot:GSA120T00011196001.1